jgi:hypothetical protein
MGKKDKKDKKEKEEKDGDNNGATKGADGESNPDEGPTYNPEYQAQMVIAAIKQYQLEVYAKVVDLGDDLDYANLIKCMTLIREYQHPAVQDCSVLLVSGGDTHVSAMVHSANPEKLNPQEWIRATLDPLPHAEHAMVITSETQGRVATTQDAPPIKAKETALSNNFVYLRKIGAMPKEDDDDDQFVDYAEML